MQTLQEIKDKYIKEMIRVCVESGIDAAQQDIIESAGSIVFDKAYQVGLEKGWAFEQDNTMQQREGE